MRLSRSGRTVRLNAVKLSGAATVRASLSQATQATNNSLGVGLRPSKKTAGAFLLVMVLLVITGVGVNAGKNKLGSTDSQTAGGDSAGSAAVTPSSDASTGTSPLTPSSDQGTISSSSTTSTSTTMSTTSTSNGSGPISSQVTVNGKPVAVPQNGTVSKTVTTPNGNSYVVISSNQSTGGTDDGQGSSNSYIHYSQLSHNVTKEENE